jgi:putative transposase
LEKIEYCHNNPVKQGLAVEPTDWKWSSYGWYYGEKKSILEIDDYQVL